MRLFNSTVSVQCVSEHLFSTSSAVTLIAWNEPWWEYLYHEAFQVGLVVKNPPVNAGDIDVGLIPGLVRFRGGGHSNPLQYSCLENPLDWGARWAIVHRIAQSQTLLKWLSTYWHWQGLTIRVYFLPKGKFLNISQHTADPSNHDSVYQKLMSKKPAKAYYDYVHSTYSGCLKFIMISVSNSLYACMLSCFSHVWLFVIRWTVACQGPLSMRFSRQEYWSGLSCPPLGDLCNSGIELESLMPPALAGRFLTTSTTCKDQQFIKYA